MALPRYEHRFFQKKLHQRLHTGRAVFSWVKVPGVGTPPVAHVSGRVWADYGDHSALGGAGGAGEPHCPAFGLAIKDQLDKIFERIDFGKCFTNYRS